MCLSIHLIFLSITSSQLEDISTDLYTLNVGHVRFLTKVLENKFFHEISPFFAENKHLRLSTNLFKPLLFWLIFVSKLIE